MTRSLEIDLLVIIAKGDFTLWKELINLKKDKEIKYMVLGKEWLQLVEEKFWNEEEIEAENI